MSTMTLFSYAWLIGVLALGAGVCIGYLIGVPVGRAIARREQERKATLDSLSKFYESDYELTRRFSDASDSDLLRQAEEFYGDIYPEPLPRRTGKSEVFAMPYGGR